MPPERLRLRIGNLAKAVLVSGQAYQDPKDALHDFVSNAADEYVEAGRRGARIRVMLRRKASTLSSQSMMWGAACRPTGSGRSPATCTTPDDTSPAVSS